MLLKFNQLPERATVRPLFFAAHHKGADVYELKLLDFYTCKRNIIHQYQLPGCDSDSPQIRMLRSCNDWPDMARCSGFAIPQLNSNGY